MRNVLDKVATDQLVNENIGAILKQERQKRGWSYEELGKRIGVSASYMYRLESGQRANPSTKVLRAICELFDIEPTKVMAMEPQSLMLNGNSIDMDVVQEVMNLIVNMDVDKTTDVFILLEKVTSLQKGLLDTSNEKA